METPYAKVELEIHPVTPNDKVVKETIFMPGTQSAIDNSLRIWLRGENVLTGYVSGGTNAKDQARMIGSGFGPRSMASVMYFDAKS